MDNGTNLFTLTIFLIIIFIFFLGSSSSGFSFSSSRFTVSYFLLSWWWYFFLIRVLLLSNDETPKLLSQSSHNEEPKNFIIFKLKEICAYSGVELGPGLSLKTIRVPPNPLSPPPKHCINTAYHCTCHILLELHLLLREKKKMIPNTTSIRESVQTSLDSSSSSATSICSSWASSSSEDSSVLTIKQTNYQLTIFSNTR